jgi:AcrR family transcriptional regulator
MQLKENLRNKKAEQTRAELIKVARKIFGEKGYHATGTHEIVLAANVTRGALRHHFAKKEDLFQAVFESIEKELITPSASDTPPLNDKAHWRHFCDGLLEFIELASTKADVQRILLIDGPAVLGWDKWRALQIKYALGTIQNALEAAIKGKLMAPQNTTVLAHLILSVIHEASLIVANAKDPSEVISEVKLALNTLVAPIAE